MEKIMHTFLLQKYGEEIYSLNKNYCEKTLKELQEIRCNFTCDYYGSFTDLDFLCDVIVWKKMEA